MLDERSQTQENKYHVSMCMDSNKRGDHIKTKGVFVVTRG